MLYSLMINDMIRHKLDLQETVTTSAWDFTTLNYTRHTETQLENATNPLQTIWCDHTGVVDGNDPQGNCQSGDDEFHRGRAVAAHGCWNAPDAHPVRCAIDRNFRNNALKLGGINIFEEAQHHGVRAAEEVLTALGRPVGSSWL